MYLHQCSRVVVTGHNMQGYDVNETGAPGIVLDDSQYVEIGSGHIYSPSVKARGLEEKNGADWNTVVASYLQNGFTQVGGNSHFAYND
jgi:hypothetical protein